MLFDFNPFIIASRSDDRDTVPLSLLVSSVWVFARHNMGLLSRFFGYTHTSSENVLVANPLINTPLSLQVLFSDTFDIDDADFIKAFRAYHSSLAKASFETDERLIQQSSLIGLLGWGEHVIQIVGCDYPMPAENVESCITTAHYGPALKDAARLNQSHVLLYYRGYEINPLKQYAALALVAGFFTYFGAIVITNENAYTSFPAPELSLHTRGQQTDGNMIVQLETLPLLLLYCGFVEYDVAGNNGVCIRTYGAAQLGLPDLATWVRDHSTSQQIFDMFSMIFVYLLASGATLSEGHTMQVGDERFIKLRCAAPHEYYLDSDTPLFVTEWIDASAVNPNDAPPSILPSTANTIAK